MLLVLILFFVLNLYFIYGTRDIGRNNIKINYISHLFDNSNVFSYSSLYNYLITKLGFSFMSTGKYTSNVPETPLNPFVSYSSPIFGNVSWFNSINDNGTINLNPLPLYQYIENYRNSSINFMTVSSIHSINARVNLVPCSSNSVVATSVIQKTDQCYGARYNSQTKNTNLTYTSLDPYYTNDISIEQWLRNMTTFQTKQQAGIYLDVKSKNYIVVEYSSWRF